MILKKFNILVLGFIPLMALSVNAMEKSSDSNPSHFQEILTIALANNDSELVEYLRKFTRAAAVNKASNTERTNSVGYADPLKMAQQKQQEKALKLKKAERDNKVIKELKKAIYETDLNAVERMLNENPDLNLEAGVTSFILLGPAVCVNHYEIVKLLIERGANVNVQMVHGGEQPLQLVASPEMLQLLIDAGADWNLAEDRHTREPILVQIIKNKEIETSKKVEMIKLLAQHVDISKTYMPYGDTTFERSALYEAQELGDEDIIDLLVRLGAK